MKTEVDAIATSVADRRGTFVGSARLEMPLMPAVLLDAFVARDRAAIARIADYAVPDSFPADEDLPFLRFRREQLARDPARYPWSVRAIVRKADRRMVGFVNFHGAPGVNDVAAPDALELGWSVFPEERRRGYATETARALMEWAARSYGITHFISATTRENDASLRVHAKLGFAATGEVIDGEIVFELRLTK
ncbi:MAG: GNAT family N-acetyltransferase [Chloroflexota bacterium]|nr:GNAT family N-acetyltransferase [Chloroflexota bacterium]